MGCEEGLDELGGEEFCAELQAVVLAVVALVLLLLLLLLLLMRFQGMWR